MNTRELIDYLNEMIENEKLNNSETYIKAYMAYKYVPTINKFNVMLFEIKDDTINKQRIVRFTIDFDKRNVIKYLLDLDTRDLGLILNRLYNLDSKGGD